MSSTKKTKIKSVARNDNDKFNLREKILATARRMVLENGFASLSIRKLAEKVGYAPGTIYLYFQNRDEITREICVRGFVQLSEAIKSVAGISEPVERLYALLHAYETVKLFSTQNSLCSSFYFLNIFQTPAGFGSRFPNGV